MKRRVRKVDTGNIFDVMLDVFYKAGRTPPFHLFVIDANRAIRVLRSAQPGHSDVLFRAPDDAPLADWAPPASIMVSDGSGYSELYTCTDVGGKLTLFTVIHLDPNKPPTTYAAEKEDD